MNAAGNILIERFAVSDRVGSTKFIIQKGLVSWNSSIFSDFASQSGRDEIEEIDAPMTTLDAYLENGPAPAFIKIDAEGSELLILNGARKSVARYKSIPGA